MTVKYENAELEIIELVQTESIITSSPIGIEPSPEDQETPLVPGK